MRALVFGVTPERWTPPADAGPLVQNLARTPVALQDIADARPLRNDWLVTRPLLTGICGSDSKQILLDFGEGDSDNAMSGFCSFPQVMGHEVVAEVVELGPEAEGFDIGQRVVLNPWLSCVTRGVEPICPACEAGDLSLCWNFTTGDLTPGIHTGVSSDATGGYAELMPAHSSMLFPVPDAIPDEVAVFADPFAVSLHSITRHPPPPGGRALVWGAGALGSCAVAILRALYPDVEVAVVARFDAQADLARTLGAHHVVRLGTSEEMLEDLATWSGGVLRPTMEGLDGLAMCHPGGIDVAYDTVGKPETFTIEVRVLEGPRHAREERCARAGPLGVESLVLQGDQLGRLQRVRHRGGRRGAQARHRALPRSGGRRAHRPQRPAHPRVPAVGLARRVLRDRRPGRTSGAIKVAIDPRR